MGISRNVRCTRRLTVLSLRYWPSLECRSPPVSPVFQVKHPCQPTCGESQLPAGLIRQEFISRKLAVMSAALPIAASAGTHACWFLWEAFCTLLTCSLVGGARGLGDEQGVSEWLRLLVVIHGPSASIHTELGFTPKSQGVAAWAPFSLFLLFL